MRDFPLGRCIVTNFVRITLENDKYSAMTENDGDDFDFGAQEVEFWGPPSPDLCSPTAYNDRNHCHLFGDGNHGTGVFSLDGLDGDWSYPSALFEAPRSAMLMEKYLEFSKRACDVRPGCAGFDFYMDNNRRPGVCFYSDLS